MGAGARFLMRGARASLDMMKNCGYGDLMCVVVVVVSALLVSQ